MRPTEIGVDANEPYGDPAGRLNRQRTRRPATVLEEIDVRSVERVPRTFPFGWGQSVADAAETNPAATSAATPSAGSVLRRR